MSIYNTRKAAQVVAYFACNNSNRLINVMKVVKLVYLADREHIEKFGYPILDEPRYSLPHGPVNSYTRNLVCGEAPTTGNDWSDFVGDRSNHNIGAVKSFETTEFDELSEAELESLGKVWDNFGDMDQWALRDWTHKGENIPEWENPGGGSTEIPLKRIMTAVGFTPSEIEAQLASFENNQSFENLLNSANLPN